MPIPLRSDVNVHSRCALCSNEIYIAMKSALLEAVLLAVVFVAPNHAIAARPTQAQTWTRADANADGALSREEVRRLPKLARHFDRIDLDGDGFISGREVRVWREAARAERRNAAQKGVKDSKGIEELLRIADRDGDGAINRAELSRVSPRIARRFDLIDVDGDGSLGRDELERWLASLRIARRSTK